MQVAVLLPDQYYSSHDHRCVGSNLLEADFREVSQLHFLIAKNKSLKKVGPAILAGLEEGVARGWLHNITFNITFWDTQCNYYVAKDVYGHVNSSGSPHVMFGPSCDDALPFAAFNHNGRRKFPLLTAGGLGGIFSERKNQPGTNYYMLTRTGVSYRDVAKTFIKFMQVNKWKKFVMAYEKQDRLEWTGDRSCEFFVDAVKSQTTGTNLTYSKLHLEDYEAMTHERHIESDMTMLNETLPSRNSRYKGGFILEPINSIKQKK